MPRLRGASQLRDAQQHSGGRRCPSLCIIVAPSQTEGAGNAGRSTAPAALRATRKNTQASHHRYAETIRHSLRDGVWRGIFSRLRAAAGAPHEAVKRWASSSLEHNSTNSLSRDGRPCATKTPRDSTSPPSGVAVGDFTRVSFRRPVPAYNSKSSRRHLTTIALVLLFAIVGSLGAVLLRTARVAEASAAIVDLRRSLP